MTGPVLVELVNGEIVTSDAEAWRHQKEAEAILALPTLEQRREWLDNLENGWTSATGRKMPGRGSAAVNALRETMFALHEKAKAA